MRKRIIAFTIILFFAGFTAWLVIEASAPEVLPEGSLMPGIKYTDKKGTGVLMPDSIKRTMVIYFSSGCTHCKYELGEINKNIGKFASINIYLFTTEKDFFKKTEVKRWDVLYKTNNVCFGIIDKNEYENKFGSMVTPSIFIFNAQGKLEKKIIGEMKIEILLKDLKLA